MKSSLQPPLDEWNNRHQALREKSDNPYLDLLHHRCPQWPKDGILMFLEARRTALVQALQSDPDTLTARNCGLMAGRLADGTYDPAKSQPQAVTVVNGIATR